MSSTAPAEATRDDAPVTTSKTADGDRALLAETVTINRLARELYEFWRNPANLTPVLENIRSIEPIDETRSRWTVEAAAGREVSWESRRDCVRTAGRRDRKVHRQVVSARAAPPDPARPASLRAIDGNRRDRDQPGSADS